MSAVSAALLQMLVGRWTKLWSVHTGPSHGPLLVTWKPLGWWGTRLILYALWLSQLPLSRGWATPCSYTGAGSWKDICDTQVGTPSLTLSSLLPGLLTLPQFALGGNWVCGHQQTWDPLLAQSLISCVNKGGSCDISCLTFNHRDDGYYERASWVALVVKNPPANAGDIRDVGSVPGPGRSPREGNGYPLQCSCLENLRDRGAWLAPVHRVAKSDMTEAT